MPDLPQPTIGESGKRRFQPFLPWRIATGQAIDVEAALFEHQDPNVSLPDEAIFRDPERLQPTAFERANDALRRFRAPAVQRVAVIDPDIFIGQHPSKRRLLNDGLLAAHKCVHGFGSFRFGLPLLSGHPKASGAAPKDKVCFLGGTAKAQPVRKDGGGAETRRADEFRKQKTAVPQGAGRPRGRQAKLCPRGGADHTTEGTSRQ